MDLSGVRGALASGDGQEGGSGHEDMGAGMSGLADARMTPVCRSLFDGVLAKMSGREFRIWYSGSCAVSGREFYEGKP